MKKSITVNDGPLIARLNKNLKKNAEEPQPPTNTENSIRDCVSETEHFPTKSQLESLRKLEDLRRRYAQPCPTDAPVEAIFPSVATIDDLLSPNQRGVRCTKNAFENAIKKANECTYEHVNHPAHYNNYDVEVVEMMRRIWGDEDTAKWCKMTAFKYRMRMGTKPDNDISQDIKKEQWYLNKAKELMNDN